MTPVILSDDQVAAMLGMASSTFKRRRPELIESGLPRPDPVLGGTYLRAIIKWLDNRHGLDPESQTIKGSKKVDLTGLENWHDVEEGSPVG